MRAGQRGRAVRRAAAIALLAGSLSTGGSALAPPAAAQTPAASPPAAAPTPAQPTPPPEEQPPAAIPLSEVGPRLEPATRRLQQIAALLAPTPEITEVEQAQPSGWDAITAGIRHLAAVLANHPSLGDLQDVDDRVRTMQRQLATWQGVLADRTQQLERVRTELQRVRETWDLTLDAAQHEGAPAELVSGVKALEKQIKAVQKQLDDRFEALLRLQSRVSVASLSASVIANDLRRARWETRGRLLDRNRPPLLAEVTAQGSGKPVWSRVVESVGRDLDTLRIFASLNRARLIWHGVLFGIFVLLTVRMRWWVAERRRQGRTLGPSEAVFDHPFSAAILLAAFVMPWIYPSVPRAMRTLFGLVLVVPVVALLPGVLAPSLRRLWYALAAFFVIDRLRGVITTIELLDRFVFLAEMAAAAALCVWLLRGERIAALAPPRARRLLRALVRLACGMLVVSVVADVLGYLSLASLLGEGTLRSAYAAVLLYGTVHVFEPLVAAALQSPPARASHVLQGRRRTIETRVARLLTWAATGLWTWATLRGFSLDDAVAEAIHVVVASPISIGDASFTLGDVLLFLATIGAAVLLSRAVRALLNEEVFPRTHLGRGVPHAVSTTVGYALVIGGFLLAASAAGFEWSRVTLLAGAFGVGIGFGLQNIVNNFVSGLILLYERPVQVGDTVEIGSLIGEVRRIGIRSSTVRTWQGAEVIVPNANLIAEQVVNWTLSDRQRRIDIPVGVAYGTDPERVIQLLREVATAHPDVLDEPSPAALFKAFGDSSLDFELRIWTVRVERFLTIRSEVVLGIHAALAQAGIAIPFPQRDLHVASLAPDVATLLRKE